jgi:AmmeMemoRadiSam system protein A
MEIVKTLGADKGIVLKRANSGDIFGDHHRVVGYGAVAFYKSGREDKEENGSISSGADKPESDLLTINEQKRLLGISRYVLEYYVKNGKTPRIEIQDERFKVKRGVFVTLKIRDQLRGCIGYILPRIALLDAVVENTVNACAKDPRFRPVTSRELDEIDIEISVLTPPSKVSSYHDIVVGKHGIILKKGFYQAVFLPQVATEQGWDLETTLTHLSLKAGMRSDGWKTGAEFEVFEAQVFGEKELGRQIYKP